MAPLFLRNAAGIHYGFNCEAQGSKLIPHTKILSIPQIPAREALLGDRMNLTTTTNENKVETSSVEGTVRVRPQVTINTRSERRRPGWTVDIVHHCRYED